MDFVYSDEQQMLRDSVDRFGTETWPATGRQRTLNDTAWLQARWAEMAELGWLMLPIAEEDGGLGGSAADVMAIAEGLGRHLVASPYITSCVLVPALLRDGGVSTADLLGGIAAGDIVAAAALLEPDSGYNLHRVAVRAEKSGDTYRLSGVKVHVEDGADARRFVVSARTAGADDEASGISLFLVESDAPGLQVDRFRAVDGHRHARLTLNGVEATLAGAKDAALPIIEAAVDRAICAHLAEATGSMEAANETTLEFLGTRQQFGVAIGSFQALQHKMVDMTVAAEEARALTLNATLSLERPRLERRRAVSAAKARVGQSGLHVGREAVQLHGGVGFSEEYIVSHHLRRQMMLDVAHGTSDHHVGQFVAASRALREQGLREVG